MAVDGNGTQVGHFPRFDSHALTNAGRSLIGAAFFFVLTTDPACRHELALAYGLDIKKIAFAHTVMSGIYCTHIQYLLGSYGGKELSK